MKNVAYGTALENLRNRIDVRLVSSQKEYLRWTSKPSYMSRKIFENDLITIHKSNVTPTLHKPVCIGMCILELSKVLISQLHCGYIKNKYGNKSKLSFTDTDSLMY